MEVKGILLALPDIAPETTEQYNRWYDLDHLAEHVAKPDVIMGRRYVAPADLRELEGVVEGELTSGYPRYATIYAFGVEDFTSDEHLAGWKTLDRGLIKGGRFWQVGPVHGLGRWRVAETAKRASLLVSDRAVPYVAHRGIIIALGRPPAPDKEEEAAAWWRDTHLPDLLTVPGILAGIRYTPAEEGNRGLMCHVILLEDDPLDVMPRIRTQLEYSHSVGRYPAFGGVYDELAFLPYRSIVPLGYGFEF